MAVYFRPNINGLAGYTPGEQPRDDGIIKLNTNENPYPPSPKVYAALRQAVGRSLRLYPEPLSDTLRMAAAGVYGVKAQNIIGGNGSDEILTMLMRCFVGPGDLVAFPEPTYSLYETLVAIQDGIAARVDFPPDFSLPESLARQNAKLTLLCNPNAPSGTLVSLPDIENLARSLSGILVVDEAYVDFAASEGASALPLIRRLPNLVVLRTFSKAFSLAGMRIGMAFGPEEIISGMMKVKDSYNVNRLSLVAATAALQDMAWMARYAGRIQRSRNKLAAGLKRLGYFVYPSHANFVLARKRGVNQKAVYEELKYRKILVRYFDAPGLEDCLRITVGAPKEIQALLTELAAIRA
ncbi:MAG TPA: histidinol-phosphate transaminase [Candidatus Limnocylindria bacterium]|nr:histidinol-phosphate transaminase [Candidatus Limnocylindria bacterium]